jgi:uncharacterized protein YfaS (alpha-2-macroglobulin family)
MKASRVPPHVALILAVMTFSWGGAVVPARAQARAGDTQPAFTLGSSHIFSTREQPAFSLTFRRLDHLDFRVYRVNDATKFFAGLYDPHVLGSEKPIVPEEQTWLERIAAWKANMRATVQAFARRQFSRQYRRQRSEQADKQQVQLRRTVNYRNFAQVPVLNESQIVSSWREILPPVHDTESRRIPLGVKEPGVYVVEAVAAPLKAYTIVIVSDVGLVTKSSPGQVIVFAANRFSGEPLANCDVAGIVDRQIIASGATAADGTFEVRLARRSEGDFITLARCGTSVAVSDPGSWYLQEAQRELVGYIYTDKPIYRPGHTVRLKGVLRWRERGLLGKFDRPTVEVGIADVNEKVVYREQRPVDQYGAVQATFPVPPGAALGDYTVTIQSDDQSATGSFEVQEYRKPEFEVIVTAPNRFVIQGDKAVLNISARYYFGQPVAGAVAKYVLHQQGYYSPLRWGDENDEEGGGQWWGGGKELPSGSVKLDDQGAGVITVPTEVAEGSNDYSLRVEARVTDASGREVSGNTIVHATYANFLLTADVDRYLYAPGSAAEMRLRAVDYVGNPQAGRKVNVWLEKVQYEERGQPKVTKITESVVDTDTDGRASWAFTFPNEPGNYRLRGMVQAGDRAVQCQVSAWVPGRTVTTGMESEDQYLELISDKKEYAPGDTARLTIKGGRADAPMLVTKETQEVSWRQLVRTGGDPSFDVPITDDDVGDTWVNVVYLKDDRLFRAEKRVKVPATSRQLQISVTADQPVSRPRQPGMFTVKVADAAGKPVRAQLSLGVIDEAVYGVKPEDTPDPLRFFYRRQYSRVGTQFSREYSFVGFSGTQQLLLAQRHTPHALADFKADRPVQPQVRKEFPDAIFWAGDLLTDADGIAHVQVAYPDSLTTWRLTARAVTMETLVGSAVARTTTTKDLILRVITPRFLTEGDEATIPAIVHNYLPQAKTVSLSMKAEGVTSVDAQAAAPRMLQIPQKEEQRTDWRYVASQPGVATFTGTATADVDSDALQLSLPVLPYGLKRQAGAAGSVVGPGEASAELVVPDTANAARRTIRVSVAPSLAGALLGALDFLTSYPYGCTEQTLSSFVPNVLVLRALQQLKIAPTERLQSLDRQTSEGLKRLYDYQHDDGGWGWWKTDENQPFMTAYALYGLVEAKRSGYRVDLERISRGASALAQLYAKYPRAVPEVKAYIAYVLTLTTPEVKNLYQVGDTVSSTQTRALNEAWDARARMSSYGNAFLLLALNAAKDPRAADVATNLMATVQTKGDLAWWSAGTDPLLEDYGDMSVEATAVIVQGLVERDPHNPMLEKAVRWLLLNRNFGTYWSSTKQTAMVLYGLLEYMQARGETGGASSVDVFVNGQLAGTRTFTAADLTAPDPVVIAAPAKAGGNAIRLVKRGAGALYWSATAEYFDRAGPLERTGTRKLALVRNYYSLEPVVQKNGRVVYRETPLANAVQPGDILLVRLTAAGSPDWRYLMIEDPLPAGAEPIKQADMYELEGDARTRWYRWYNERREYRDDKVVFFQTDFAAGRYEYSYLLKVVTPGAFKAMPAQISSMYIPGSSAWTDVLALAVSGPDSNQPPRARVPK